MLSPKNKIPNIGHFSQLFWYILAEPGTIQHVFKHSHQSAYSNLRTFMSAPLIGPLIVSEVLGRRLTNLKRALVTGRTMQMSQGVPRNFCYSF